MSDSDQDWTRERQTLKDTANNIIEVLHNDLTHIKSIERNILTAIAIIDALVNETKTYAFHENKQIEKEKV